VWARATPTPFAAAAGRALSNVAIAPLNPLVEWLPSIFSSGSRQSSRITRPCRWPGARVYSPSLVSFTPGFSPE